MKFKTLLPKFFAAGFFSASLFVFSPAQAQLQWYTSPNPDMEAAPGRGAVNGVNNTGADAMLDDKGRTLQVMTWDGDEPTFSWRHENGNEGYFHLQDPMGPEADPDVVVAKHLESKTIYALVVYIDSQSKIRWERYTWDAGVEEFVYGGSSSDYGILGTKECSYPNIDANKEGRVAITWQESVSEDIHVQVTSAFYNLIYDYDTFVTWNNIYGASGDIDGSAYQSNSGRIKGMAGGVDGDLVSNQLKVGEQNSQPDVAISEIADERIFFTYIKRSADASGIPSVFRDHLVVQKENMMSLNGTNVTVLATSPYFAKPRIAASPNMRQYNSREDYEIAVLKNPNGCGVVPLWEIWNYGVTRGNRHKDLLVNETLTYEENLDPVVSYSGGEEITDSQVNGYYTIAWTATVEDQGINKDILARAIQNDNLTPGFSVVNKETDGVQHLPSIAGRFLENQLMYEFFNEQESFIGYKLSGKKAGAEDVRIRPNGSNPSTVYPNPFSKEVNFNYTIEKGEKPSEILVYSITGQVVDRVTLKDALPGKYTQNIKLSNSLPDGVYILKLKTSKKSETFRITKMN